MLLGTSADFLAATIAQIQLRDDDCRSAPFECFQRAAGTLQRSLPGTAVVALGVRHQRRVGIDEERSSADGVMRDALGC